MLEDEFEEPGIPKRFKQEPPPKERKGRLPPYNKKERRIDPFEWIEDDEMETDDDTDE